MNRKIRFCSTIPAPWGDGFVLPASVAGTERITAALQSRVTSVSDVVQHESYGWGFFSTFEQCDFDNVVNPIDEGEWWLSVSMLGYLIRKLTFRNPRRTFDRYCDVLQAALREVPEFSNLEWRDYDS